MIYEEKDFSILGHLLLIQICGEEERKVTPTWTYHAPNHLGTFTFFAEKYLDKPKSNSGENAVYIISDHFCDWLLKKQKAYNKYCGRTGEESHIVCNLIGYMNIHDDSIQWEHRFEGTELPKIESIGKAVSLISGDFECNEEGLIG